MKRRSVISFLISLLLFSVTFGVIVLILKLMTFNLAGGETLREIENQKTALFIIALLYLAMGGVIAGRFFKKKKKYSAYGIVIAVALIGISAVSLYFINKSKLHVEFNKVVWGKSKIKPFDMAATLVEEKKLIGLTKAQVLSLLGSHSEEHIGDIPDRTVILYDIKEDWTLSIYFEKDKVINAELRLPFLGV